MAGAVGCERIHKEENADSKVLLIFPTEERDGCEEIHQQQNVGAVSFIWVIKGWGCSWVVMAISCKTGGFRLSVQASVCLVVILGSGSRRLCLVCSVCESF